MQKMIKLTETHYIVVNDSEIKEGDFVFQQNFERTNNEIIKIEKEFQAKVANDKEGSFTKRKITHSNQPLEPSIKSNRRDNLKEFVLIKPLSLSEIEEAIYGYSVDSICEKEFNIKNPSDETRWKKALWKDGFKAHQELVKNKLFTVEDMMDAMGFAAAMDNKKPIQHLKKEAEEYIKTKKLPKTEWECCISDGKLVLL